LASKKRFYPTGALPAAPTFLKKSRTKKFSFYTTVFFAKLFFLKKRLRLISSHLHHLPAAGRLETREISGIVITRWPAVLLILNNRE